MFRLRRCALSSSGALLALVATLALGACAEFVHAYAMPEKPPAANHAHAPPAPSPAPRPRPVTWQRAVGDSRNQELDAVAAAPDGGWLLAGKTNSRSNGSEHNDGWVIRLEGNGNLLWQRKLGGAKNSMYKGFNAVAVAPAGGWLLVGFNHVATRGENTKRGWAVRLDEQGHPIWQRTFGEGLIDEVNAVAPAADGGWLLAGSTLFLSENGNRGFRGWAVRLNAQGEILWQRSFTNAWNSRFDAVAAAADGGWLLAGKTEELDASGEFKEYGWVMRLDDQGNAPWQELVGEENDIHAVAAAPDGGCLAVGTTPRSDKSADTYGVVARLDRQGNGLWVKYFPGPDETQERVNKDEFNALASAPDGSWLVAGTSNDQGWVERLGDDHGGRFWERTFGGMYPTKFYATAAAADGGWLLAGEIDVDGHKGWVLKVDDRGRLNP